MYRVIFLCMLTYFLNFNIGDSKTYKFDFGKENSPVMEGFIKVTENTLYTKERGFGWEKTEGLKSEERRPRTGGDIIPDELCGDFVTNILHPFILDIPNGKYKVILTIGDIGEIWFYPSKSILIEANGEKVYEEIITSKNFFTDEYFFRSKNKEWKKEDNEEGLWRKWIEPIFRTIKFDVSVKSNKIVLNFSPSSCLTYMIIYPIEETDIAEMEIQEINKNREKNFRKKYYKIEPTREGTWSSPLTFTSSSQKSSTFEPSEIQKNRGYVVFVKDYLEPVFSDTLPPSEIEKGITLFGAKGENVIGKFCIYPLKRLKEVKIEITDLVNEKGDILSKEKIKVYRVTYNEVPHYMRQDKNSYQILPKFLWEKDKYDYEEGITRQIWINISIPENIKEGDYIGKIIFKPSNATFSEIALKVKVLPFTLLPMPEDVCFGFYYYLPDWLTAYFPDEEKFWEMVKNELIFMKEHNITSVLVGLPLPPIKVEDGKVIINFEKSYLEKFCNLWKEVGFRSPICWYHFTDNLLREVNKLEKFSFKKYDLFDPKQFDEVEYVDVIKNICFQIENYRKEKKFPEIYYYVSDEYGAHYGEKGIEWAKKITQIYHQIPGMKVIGGVCNDLETQLFPFFDISLLNTPVLTKENIAHYFKHDKKIGFYNLGRDRLSNGFYLWKLGAKIKMEWVFGTRNIVDPYNPFDGVSPDLSIAYPSLEGPVTTMDMEIMKKGLDDYRYCYTLKTFIEKLKKTSNPQYNTYIDKAEKTLEYINSRIKEDFLWYTKEGEFPSFDVYDKFRWKIAQEIIQLKEFLKEEVEK